MAKDDRLPEGIYLRGGIYWVRWSDGHGRKIRESTGKNDLEFAKAWIEARRTAVRQGKAPEMIAEIERKKKVSDGNYTFGQLAKSYSEDAEIISQSYWTTKKYAVTELSDRYGHLPVINLSPRTVLEDLKTSRKKPTKKNPAGELLAEGTVAKKFLVFSHILTKGVEYGMCPQSICDNAHSLGVKNPSGHRTNWLQENECQALISACGPLLRPVIVTAIMTGLRRADVLNLKWRDIDFRNGFVRVVANKNKAVIELSMDDKYKAMLENLPRHGEYVFMTGKDQMFAKDFRKSFRTARRLAGIPDDFQYKDLRHTFASLLINSGVNIKIIKDSLGHSTYKMMDRYTHINNEQLRKAGSILGAVIPDETPAKQPEI